MDFNDLMKAAENNKKESSSKKGYSNNLSTPKKQQKPKQRSEVVQKLIDEKEREKALIIERRKQEEKKKIFRIPKGSSSDSKDSGSKKSHKEKSRSKSSSTKVDNKPKVNLEEKIFQDLQDKNELYNQKDRARINFDGSFAVVRIAHKPRDGVPIQRRPVAPPVKETPKFNVALVKKADTVSSDGSNFNTHQASSASKNVHENVKQLKEKYGTDPNGLPKKERKKSTTRRDNKLKEIEKYKEKIRMREKLKNKQKERLPKPKPKIIRRAGMGAPPPMNFNDLLKLAEVKSKEPVVLEKAPKIKKEKESRPLTQADKEWEEKQKDWKDRRKTADYQKSIGRIPKTPKNDSSESSARPKSTHKSGPTEHSTASSAKHRSDNTPVSKNNTTNNKIPAKSPHQPKPGVSNTPTVHKNLPSKTDHNVHKTNNNPKSNILHKQLTASRDQRGYEQNHNRNNSNPGKQMSAGKNPQSLKRKGSENVLECGPPKKKAVPSEEATNPWDRIYGNIQKNHPKKAVKKKMVIDSDDEYDSELDDFIDDGDDGAEDYSSAIRQIFNYDKRRYRDDDDDVDNMESNFASCMKEEARSARLGLQEDLEDIKKEQEEERRKALKRKMRR